jgi:TPP-dependent pyruvate/acetoin dehydrogenase alpha subunit
MKKPELNQMSDYLYQMLKIRKFEERLNHLFSLGHIHGTIHLYVGQEAVAVGVCGALEKGDYITSTHRGRGCQENSGGSPGSGRGILYGAGRHPAYGGF